MTFLRYYLFIAPHVLLALFLLILWLRRLQTHIPVFTVYVIIEEIVFLCAMGVTLHRPFSRVAYSWVVLLGNGLTSVLVLGVVYKLADILIFSRFSFPRLRTGFAGTLAALVLFAGLISGNLAKITVPVASNILHVIDFCAGLIQAGMLLLLLGLSRALHVSWRNFETGVALGFGVSACILLAGAALRDHFGHGSIIAVDILEMTTFHISVVIWLIYALLPEGARPPGTGLDRRDLESWSQELRKMAQN